MAVRTQFLEQGLRNAVMLFTNDGATDESAGPVTKVDVTAMTPACLRVDIERITWSLGGTAGATLAIYWDATTDDIAWTIPNAESGGEDFKLVGGLINPKSAGWNGNILFKPSAASMPYSVILWLEKKQD